HRDLELGERPEGGLLARERELRAHVREEREPELLHLLVEGLAARVSGVDRLRRREPLHEHGPGLRDALELLEGVLAERVDARPDEDLRVPRRDLERVLVRDEERRALAVEHAVLAVDAVEREEDEAVEARRQVELAAEEVDELPVDLGGVVAPARA